MNLSHHDNSRAVAWMVAALYITYAACIFYTPLTDTSLSYVLKFQCPRFFLACIVGFNLAQTGAVTQALFKNPLAEPSLIGVSSGSGLGAILAWILLPPSSHLWSVPLSSFSGALLISALVCGLTQRKQSMSVMTLLLSGLMLSVLIQAMITLLSLLCSSEHLRHFHLWQLGTLVDRPMAALWSNLILAVIGVCYFQSQARAYDTLFLGEHHARYLGVDIKRVQLGSLSLIAASVGMAVATCGFIGFIGLVVPHAARMMVGVSYQKVLPLSGALGGLLLVGSDGFAGTLAYPAELPVGMITCTIGAPLFLALLYRHQRRG